MKTVLSHVLWKHTSATKRYSYSLIYFEHNCRNILIIILIIYYYFIILTTNDKIVTDPDLLTTNMNRRL
jgi:hypothetical protein